MRSSAPFTLWRPGTDAAGLSASLFDGDIVVFRRLPAVQRLADPETPGTPVLIEPDDLLGFSAAHLHAGQRDASGHTRFGIDSRTVWEPDRRAGRCAPDVDGTPGTEMWEWFDAPEVAGARG